MKRSPDFIVGDPDAPYLLRWYLIRRNRWLNLYLHKFLRDDDDRALHDHPWYSVSLVIGPGYYEITKGPDGTELRRFRRRGSIVFRKPTTAHRIELLRDENGIPIPCRTLFLTGPRVREWGFWCPKGWRHWREFCDDRDHGKVGRGCE